MRKHKSLIWSNGNLAPDPMILEHDVENNEEQIMTSRVIERFASKEIPEFIL